MEVIVENIKYYLDTDKKTAVVIGYQDYPVEVIIPELIEYKNEKFKVTIIRKQAFYECKKLTSITIPNSVTSIGEKAFYNCKNLQSINIPYSVTKIGNSVFSHCWRLTSITIPDSVTKIEYSAFYGCDSLTSITIPNSVKYIGHFAFFKIGLTLPKRYTEDGKLIAYKVFDTDMTYNNFQYEEGKTFEREEEIKIWECGFHACTNPLDIFNDYWGTTDKDFVIHEVYLSGDFDKDYNYDSSLCASKIEIGRRLSIKDINDIINSK